MIQHTYDIRARKKNLRRKYKKARFEMEPDVKRINDARIRGRVLRLPEYRAADTLLSFVSLDMEVDTIRLIERALADGKRVAVPYCVTGTRLMRFYRINSLDELRPGAFGVMEPDPDKAELVDDYSRSLCILPGLAFDYGGYRIGYGGGYYDRFLSREYSGSGGVTAGVCYASCMNKRLPRGRFDIPCDIVVTEKHIRRPRKSASKSPEQPEQPE